MKAPSGFEPLEESAGREVTNPSKRAEPNPRPQGAAGDSEAGPDSGEKSVGDSDSDDPHQPRHGGVC